MAKPFSDLLYGDLDTPRGRRMTRFANAAEQLLDELVPRDRDVRRAFRDRLSRIGWEGNYELIEVPEAWDALDEAALKAAMLEAKIAKFPPVFPPKAAEASPNEPKASGIALQTRIILALESCEDSASHVVALLDKAGLRIVPKEPEPAREVDAVLRNWSATPLGEGTPRYRGVIFHDRKNRFADGEVVTTSTVLSGPDADGVIVTKNSTYRLEPKP